AYFGDPFEESTRVHRELVVRRYAHGRFGPTRHLFEYGLGGCRRMSAVGQDIEKLALVAVSNADLELFEAIQNVELRNAQTRDSVDHDGPLHCRPVKPTTAAWTAGHRAELFTHCSQ